MNKQSVANVGNHFWNRVRNDCLRSDVG